MTTEHHPDPALTAYAERLCQGAGTDLDAALAALTSGHASPAVPAALRDGWATADLAMPVLEDQEPLA